MHTKFEETNALLRAILKLQKDWGRYECSVWGWCLCLSFCNLARTYSVVGTLSELCAIYLYVWTFVVEPLYVWTSYSGTCLMEPGTMWWNKCAGTCWTTVFWSWIYVYAWWLDWIVYDLWLVMRMLWMMAWLIYMCIMLLWVVMKDQCVSHWIWLPRSSWMRGQFVTPYSHLKMSLTAIQNKTKSRRHKFHILIYNVYVSSKKLIWDCPRTYHLWRFVH